MASQLPVTDNASVFVISTIPGLIESMQHHIVDAKLINALITDSNEITLEDRSKVFNAEIVVTDPKLLPPNLHLMPNLKWVHSTWAGVEPIVKNLTHQPNFIVSRHAGEEFCSIMAEYVMCQVLNWERNMRLVWQNQINKSWIDVKDHCSYRSLSELSVAVLGVGNMGKQIGKFFKQRGSSVCGFARTFKDRPDIGCSFNEISVDLSRVLGFGDYIINTLPSTHKTAGLLNNSVLKQCSKKPVFINVGRGDIIDDAELIKAIEQDWLSGAVLDVFKEEPLKACNALWEIPKVVITPHCSALSRPDHIAREFARSFIAYKAGHKVPNSVNWDEKY